MTNPETRRRSRLRTLLIAFIAIDLLIAAAVLLFLRANRTNGMIISGGERRSYLLYVPDSYQPGTPTPLVISFHGFVEWPAHQQQVSRWNEVADREGFIVVYPAGTDFPFRWRAGGSGQELSGTEAGSDQDVQFIRELIDALSAEYSIDPGRIYANGLSNGAGMTFLLTCRLSDRIAAAGGVAGAYLLPWEQCNPERPVPLIAFHGDADPIVPFQGGPSDRFDIPFPFIPDWASVYAEQAGCDPQPELLPAPGAASLQRFACPPGMAVDFYSIAGGGHTWPGGVALPEWITGPTSMDISASELMWEFFQQHSLEFKMGDE